MRDVFQHFLSRLCHSLKKEKFRLKRLHFSFRTVRYDTQPTFSFFSFTDGEVGIRYRSYDGRREGLTTDVITIDALKLFEKVVFCEACLSSRRKYKGISMFKTVSKPLAHLNFLSGVNCEDIGSIV